MFTDQMFSQQTDQDFCPSATCFMFWFSEVSIYNKTAFRHLIYKMNVNDRQADRQQTEGCFTGVVPG